MAWKTTVIYLLIALEHTVIASVLGVKPKLLGTEGWPPEKVANLTWHTDRRMLAAWGCRGQSCLIADTAGSTGRIPNMKAEGATDADIACIAAHNPDVAALLQKYNNQPPDVPKQDTGIISTMMKA